ncbi:hypothetical protein [Halomicronema sp. CCY15110]|uniref:hypothetical protein n=1 Tax=Halomicronema sp. CCY15110 TaxID=2767773 RepID=UPI00194EA194|nr:hypothetical protein [Halomicronema sp. CCY15110]
MSLPRNEPVPLRRKSPANSWTKGLRGFISFFALFVAVGFLLFQLVSSILLAFSESGWIGFRSLAAAAFPLSVAIYLGFLARMKVPIRESRAPIINSFILFLLWTLLLLGIDRSNQLVQFPLEELLYGSTIAAMIWRYKYRDSFKALLACCYGIISGALAAVILFGINPTAL